ncbi:MAG: PAS domain-containing sensor histidine kinase [Candidatus Schekmanbacteria bacterium]|nr:PAS domain-containing sensor histidine kinase [Candidatus Schekmanbacteria bacterium]
MTSAKPDENKLAVLRAELAAARAESACWRAVAGQFRAQLLRVCDDTFGGLGEPAMSDPVAFRIDVDSAAAGLAEPGTAAAESPAPETAAATLEKILAPLDPAERERVQELLATSPAAPDACAIIVHPARIGHDETAAVIVTGSRCSNPGGDGAGVHGIALEITAEKQRADRTASRLAFLAALTASARVAMIGTDAAGTIVLWMDSAQSMFGYAAGDIVGRPLSALLADRHRSEEQPFGLRVGGRTGVRVVGAPIEVAGHRRDGSEFPVELTLCLWTTSSRRFVTVLARDISARKEVERQLQKANEELRRANELKTEFLAVLSHDLRSPLSTLLSAVGALRESTAASAERRGEILAIIERNARRQLRMIEDLLTITRIEAGRLVSSLRRIDLRHPVTAVVTEARIAVEQRGQQLHLMLPPHPVEVLAEEDRIAQAVGNLLSNAMGFAVSEIRVTVSITDESEARVTVENDGPEIAADRLERIFDRFAKSRTHPERTGSGLGLAIVRGIMRAHGGRAWAENIAPPPCGGPRQPADLPGRGARFVVTLPLAP